MYDKGYYYWSNEEQDPWTLAVNLCLDVRPWRQKVEANCKLQNSANNWSSLSIKVYSNESNPIRPIKGRSAGCKKQEKKDEKEQHTGLPSQKEIS